MRPFASLLGRIGPSLIFVLCGLSVQAQIGVRGWPQFAGDPQHTGRSYVASNDMFRIRWTTPVDLAPSGLIHYGAPLITPSNTICVTVKTTSAGDYQIQGRNAVTGAVLYTEPTDYVVPSNTGWIPPCGSTLTPDNRLVTPAIGGTVLIRSNADDPNATVTRVAFYGIANYNANPSAFNTGVKINTPILCDAQGNVYFGFLAGSNPLNLTSGLARISAAGVGTWISAATLTGVSGASVAQNAEPAMSNDGTSVYVATNGSPHYLVRCDSTSLARTARIQLSAPGSFSLPAQSSACPMVGPDGDVYFGVNGGSHGRGWMLHYDGALTTQKPTGAFGWDNTASVVPTSMVPSYSGSSPYLIMTKYNDYTTLQHRVAILDPNATMTDPVTGVPVMNMVISQLGPTPNGSGVYEWCVNNAAVDPLTDSVLVNSEDGSMYRWNLGLNTLTQTVNLTNGVGEAYTMTSVGPDGTIYAINNEDMFALSDNTIVPTAFSLTRGFVFSGGLTQLLYSEDSRLAVSVGLTLSSLEPPIQIVLDGPSFTASATSLSFAVEGQASTVNIRQRIELMNFASSSYETVDTRNATTADSVASVTVSGDPNRFIDPVSHTLRAKISFFATGPVSGSTWQARIDRTWWTVNP